MYKRAVIAILTLFMSLQGQAGQTEVINVDVRKLGTEQFNFTVTLRHADSGWEHYANKWEVVDSDGNIYGTRILHHPHVNEQPFTRSLSHVVIPRNIRSIIIRGYDSIHGKGEQEYKVELPK